MPNRKLPSRSGGTSLKLRPELAIAAIAMYSGLSDGEVNETESVAIDAALLNLDFFSDYSDEDLQELGTRVGRLFEKEGIGAAVDMAIASLEDDVELQESALMAAFFILIMDGEMPEEEEEYLNDLYQALNIDYDRYTELLEMVVSSFDEAEFDEE
jgi:tellurite resistance protein